MPIQSNNPATEETLQTFNEFTAGQIDAALEQAHRASQRWRTTSFAQRAVRMRAGYGRELGVFGIREFTNIQTVCIGTLDSAAAMHAAVE